MSKIPAAARSLSYKNGLIPWAYTQFNKTILQKTRNAGEEQGRLIEIVENAVLACSDRVVISTGPKHSPPHVDGGVNGHGGQGGQHAPELSSKDKGWIGQAQTFVNLAIRTAGTYTSLHRSIC